MSQSQAIRYPLDKDQYGRALWQIIHSYTATMPDKLNTKQRHKFHNTLTDLIEHIPCDDCKNHAKAYMKDNKPTYKSSQDAFNYYCSFHNHINESQGKPVQDCETLWQNKDKPCTDCSATPTSPHNPTTVETSTESNKIANPKQATSVDHFLNQSLKTSLEDYKNVSTRMFKTMCENAGAPMPELIFSEKTECSNPESSCTHFPIDKHSGKLADAPTRVYLNINQYSPRSVIHEALHYISKVKGIDVLTPSHEDEITKKAREIMARDFPQSYRHSPQTPIHEVRDEITPAEVNPYKNFKERSQRRLDGFTSSLPYYSKYYHGAKKHKKEQPSPQVVPTAAYANPNGPQYPNPPIVQAPEPPPEPASASEGFIGMLDPIFAPFGDMLGMKARDVNLAHTPALLANGGIVLVESNFNKFGSMFISLASSLATLAAGTLSKDNIGYTDKKLLVGLGGALFWSGALRYIANPKIQEEVIAQANEFGASLQSGDVNAMVASFSTEKPKEIEKDMMTKGAREIPVGPSGSDFRGPISRPLGGTERLVGRGRSSEYSLDDISGDIYSNPDDIGSAQGTFKRPSWFPSMT